MARRPRVRGTVQSFDLHRGLGVIVADPVGPTGEVGAGVGTEHPFHCIEISDGTRTIDEGQTVEFSIGFDALGRPEATAITKH